MAANPTSESELQLYRVLQRANLLQYFETFISQGGDDVQQLCEAGEEEFLEIMALVGMASKPLHVRRLQKVLQEWVTSPAVFHQPLGPHTPPPPIAPGSILASVQRPYLKMGQAPNILQKTSTPIPVWACQDTTGETQVTAMGNAACSLSPASVTGVEAGMYADSMMGMMNGLMSTGMNQQHQQQQQQQQQQEQQQQMRYIMDSPESGSGNNMIADEREGFSPGALPQLTEAQISAIERAAEELAKTLPQYEPKPLSAKKLINKEIEEVMKLPADQPERMELLRKYGCIYGRFDSRRKNEKQLSLHEISVNEASAQLCKHRVSLLTRRDDLFPLARQVVRDSGYQYSKGHSRGQTVGIPPNKKERLDYFMFEKQVQDAYKTSSGSHKDVPRKNNSAGDEKHLREARMADINRELTAITAHQQALKRQIGQLGAEEGSAEGTAAQTELQNLTARALHLLTEQSDLLRRQRSQYQQSKTGRKGDSQDDEDDDSIPFPTEAFPTSTTEDEFFTTASMVTSKVMSESRDNTNKAVYQESMRMTQHYVTGDPANGGGLAAGQITIKQEVEDEEATERDEGLEPGEVQLNIPNMSWPMLGKRAFGHVGSSQPKAIHGMGFGEEARENGQNSEQHFESDVVNDDGKLSGQHYDRSPKYRKLNVLNDGTQNNS